MELKEGMYVRTLDGIMKVVELRDDGVMTRFRNEDGNIYFTNDMMCNPSFNICDLIEAGDYVNGYKIVFIRGIKHIITENGIEFFGIFHINDIKSIVTKEQFENMQYRVGE